MGVVSDSTQGERAQFSTGSLGITEGLSRVGMDEVLARSVGAFLSSRGSSCRYTNGSGVGHQMLISLV